MDRRNWLDLSRKLVDRFDLDYTVAAMAAALGSRVLDTSGKGVQNSIEFLNSLYVLLSSVSMDVAVKSGIANDPNGQPIRVSPDDSITLTSDPVDPKWSLLVLRYLSEGDTPVPKPSDPIFTVFLNLQDSYELILRDGTPSPTPAYPATLPGDIILRGIKIPAASTLASQSELDFDVSDFSLMGADTFDNRLLPMMVDTALLALKPSQTFGQSPQKFTFIGMNVPSKFPQNVSNEFNTKDTLLNFQTGEITGGDELTFDFTPTIPALGQSIIATISLKSNHTLDVRYGVQGTLAQCQVAIRNQTYTGAGSLAAVNAYFKIAYVVLTSSDGVNITSAYVSDVRSFGNLQIGDGEYDAVTGSGSNATHATIAEALTDLAAPSKKILVGSSETINSEIVIDQDDTTLVFQPGVTLSKGSAANGIHVQANGFRCRQGRMADWSTVSDNAILIDVGSDYSIISEMRFSNNDSDITDNSTTGTQFGNVTE